MPGTSDFAYVQARLNARHGLRPGPATWSRLEGAVDVAALLHMARATTLAHWIDSVRVTSDVHTLERTLRQVWVQYVNLVASWSPPAWQQAIRWTGVLVILPALQHARADREQPTWFDEDPYLRIGSTAAAYATPPLFRGLPVAELRSAAAAATLEQGWLKSWRALWPASSAPVTRKLDNLASLVEGHRIELAGLDPGVGTANTLIALERGFRRLFRSGSQSPAAIFCHLGLCTLDLGRLKGNLVTRILFPQQPELQRWQ